MLSYPDQSNAAARPGNLLEEVAKRFRSGESVDFISRELKLSTLTISLVVNRLLKLQV